MEDEIEDIVGDVKYTDSSKSVATTNTNVYSHDFTDSSSEINNSSGKDTYVIDYESEDSEHPHEKNNNIINRNNKLQQSKHPASISTTTTLHVAQETFTQTSKTIIELAEHDGATKRQTDFKTLETQTSFISITENKTVEYMIQVSGTNNNYSKREIITDFQNIQKQPKYLNKTATQVQSDTLEEDSSKFPESETENQSGDGNESSSSGPDKVITIIDDVRDNFNEELSAAHCANNNFDGSVEYTDMEEDSLMGNDNSPRCEIDEERDASDLLKCHIAERHGDPQVRHFGNLTPLTEESNARKDSLVDITPNIENIGTTNDVIFTNQTGLKVKFLKKQENKNEFKLPPIQNQSCPNSPHLNSLFCKSGKLNKAGTLPCLYEGQRQRDSLLDRWEIENKNLASGESALINDRNRRRPTGTSIHLPPIQTLLRPPPVNVTTTNNRNVHTAEIASQPPVPTSGNTPDQKDAISIKEKIKELKMTKNTKSWMKYSVSRAESRSGSPASSPSPDGNRLCDVADRGCETLCVELLRRLRLPVWFEVMDTLDEIPKVMDKFWSVITEQRITDLIRQTVAHIESPRPQVARAACNTLAAILKNTNYTKKPDFYEAVTVLLAKTGSYSRAVRRAANVALDGVACGVELPHAVAAICVHGAGHKSPLVRCASARLLVVCCALGGGGRELLRARPSSAASARRYALRALSVLLEDKSTDTRKYAERLYSMLRPLANFEAYYLTDVDVELASRQMKRFDRLLLCGPPKDTR